MALSARVAGQCQVDLITNPTTQDNFGNDFAFAGDEVIVGAPRNGGEGVAFVLRLAPEQWLTQTLLFANDADNPLGGHLFAKRVVEENDTVVISNTHSDVYIYRRVDGFFELQQHFFEFNVQFGWSMDIRDDLLVVGAPDEDAPGCEGGGAVYLYRFDGESWIEETVLFGDYCESFAGFGRAVAAAEGLMITGDHNHDGPLTNTGAAFVYRETNPGEWVFEQLLKPSDVEPGPDGSGHQWFGFDVALDEAGDTAIIGSKENRVDGIQQAGSAYVFEYHGNKWIETAKLTANPPNPFAEFGKVVDISDDGDTIIIGETFFGSFLVAHFFRRVDDGWQEVLTVPDIGWAIDIHGDQALLSGIGGVHVYAGINDIDCNNNGEPDGCDIANGVSADVNGNGVPDECETLPDLNGDETVEVDDLLFLLKAWGTAQADINGDGVTGVDDLLMLLGAWGPLNSPVTCPDSTPGDCCETHDSPGCNDASCCDSICEIDPFCCTTTWDTICVNYAQDMCGCPPPEGCGEADAGPCCIPGGGGNGTPGCDDPQCCEIVCDYVDPFCCEVQWDAACGDWAFQLCASCPPTVCSPDAGDCCGQQGPGGNETPGCNDPACCELICEMDAFCCEIAWDGICTEQANEYCKVCGGDPPGR